MAPEFVSQRRRPGCLALRQARSQKIIAPAGCGQKAGEEETQKGPDKDPYQDSQPEHSSPLGPLPSGLAVN